MQLRLSSLGCRRLGARCALLPQARSQILVSAVRKFQKFHVGALAVITLLLPCIGNATQALPDSAICLPEIQGGGACPDSTGLAQQGLVFTRYEPKDSLGATIEDIQFTYSGGIAALRASIPAVEAALDSLAQELAVRHDNTFGLPMSDLELMFNYFHENSDFPELYGDLHFQTLAGGNFSVSQSAGGSAAQETCNHVDLVLVTQSEANQLLALECLVERSNPQYFRREQAVVAFESDRGELVPQGANTCVNAVLSWGLPTRETDVGYFVLIHELGHLFDATSMDRLWVDPEAIAQVARAICGLPIIPFSEKYPAGNNVPYGATYGFTNDGAHDIVDDVNRSVRYTGELWYSYLVEQFDQGTTLPFDDLVQTVFGAAEIDTTVQQGRFANVWMKGLASELTSTLYDDVALYPYLQDDAGLPMSGEDRLERVFHNFAIALAADQPSGRHGFPLHFDPTRHVPTFQQLWNTGNRDRATVPPEVLVSSADFGVETTLSDFEFSDVSPPGNFLEFEVFPWAMDYVLFHVDDDIPAWAGQQVKVVIEGEEVPYVEGAYSFSTSASVVFYSDIEGEQIFRSPDDVMEIVSLESESVPGGIPKYSFAIPTDGTVKHALVVLSVAEKGISRMLEREGQVHQYPEAHPIAAGAEAIGWNYSVSYSLEPSVQYKDVTDESNIEVGIVPPVAAVTSDFDGDGNGEIVISKQGIGKKATVYVKTGTGDEVNQFLNKANDVFGNETLVPRNARGLSVADFDNDLMPDLFVAMGPDPIGPQGALLYRSNGVSLLEDTSLPSGITDAWGGAWGDFNEDGYLDLYIARSKAQEPSPSAFDAAGSGEVDLLLESNVATGSGFVDVAQSRGLFVGASETCSATWSDVDLDGDLDLFVSWLGEADTTSSQLHWSPLYINEGSQAAYTFEQKSGTPAGDSPRFVRLGAVSGATFADLDGDEDPDIALSREAIVPGIPQQNVLVCYNDGSGDLTEERQDGLASETPTHALAVQDLDLNGHLDVVSAPADSSEAEAFLGYTDDSSNRVFVESGAVVGLESGPSHCLWMGDLNGDADVDVFLGRTGAQSPPSGLVYANVTPIVGNWIKVNVAGDGNVVNGSGIGTRVKVEATTPGGDNILQVQWVDGGSGRFGQAPHDLIFGIGSASSGLVSVDWPNGVTESHVVISNTILSTMTPHVPLVNNTSVVGTYTISSSSSANWVFSWITEGSSDFVEVEILGDPSRMGVCDVFGTGDLLLKELDTNVSVDRVQMPGPGVKFVHVLTWSSVPCEAPCTYSFKVRSQFGASVSESGTHQLFVSVCGNIQQ